MAKKTKDNKKNRIELRKERVQKLCNDLEQEGYTQTDLTISADVANTVAIISTLLPIAFYAILFGLLHGWAAYKSLDVGLLSSTVLLSIIVHEIIHGVFFGIFAPGHFSSIEFGVMWESVNPYCYCAKPVSKTQYLISVMMPGLILGTCVGAVSLVIGSATGLVFSLIAYLCASGDFFIAAKIFRFSVRGKKALFLDHPEKPGLIVFAKNV